MDSNVISCHLLLMIWYDMIWYDMIWYDMIWYDMIWYDMKWYDMIWFYLHKILAESPNYNVQNETKRKKQKQKQKTHSMTRNKAESTTIDNRETRPNSGAGEQRRKQKARSPIMGVCCWSTPHNMGLDYKHIYY